MAISLENKLKKENSNSLLVIITLFVVSLQTILSLLSIERIRLILQLRHITSTFLFPIDSSELILFLALPTLLCIVFSMVLTPKRIVSPLVVNIGTLATTLLLISIDIVATNQTFTMEMFGTIIASVIVSGTLLVVIGLVQTSFVKKVVGLTLIDLDRKSYYINGNDEILMPLILEFLRKWNFKKQHDKTYKLSKSSGVTIVIAVGDDKENTRIILATVAYMEGYYTVMESEESTWLRTSIMNDLTSRLKKVDKTIKVKKLKKIDDPISVSAYLQSISPTCSKLTSVKDFIDKMPRYYRNILSVTSGVFVIIAILFGVGIIKDFDSFLNIAIALLVAIIVEFGLALRSEQFRKDEKNLD